MVTAPFGAWESPVSALAVTRAARRFSDSLVLEVEDAAHRGAEARYDHGQ